MARSLQIRNQRLAAPVGSPTNIPTSSEVLHWQAAYNHACSLSIAVSSSVANALTFPKRHTQALQILDRTRELPGGGALTRAWVSIDPDLASLRPPSLQRLSGHPAAADQRTIGAEVTLQNQLTDTGGRY